MYEIKFFKKTSQDVGEKQTTYAEILGGKNPWINAEISTVNKIDNEAFSNVPSNSETRGMSKCYPQFKLFNRINSLAVFSPTS